MKPLSVLFSLFVLLYATSVNARLEAQCEKSLRPGDQAQVDLRYYPEWGDHTPGGVAVLLVANLTEQLGLMTVYGPWFRELGQATCSGGVCYGTYAVDEIPAEAQPGSIVLVQAALLDQANEEIATAGRKIRVD